MPYARPPRHTSAAAAPAMPGAAPVNATPAPAKFQRRPANGFATAPQETPKPPAVPPTEIWYNDIRFGIALFCCLILLNLGLIFALPLQSEPVSGSNVTIIQSTAQTEDISPAPNVTLYSNPTSKSAKTEQKLAESVDVAPKQAIDGPDFPPPEAAPLDSNKSMEENVNGSHAP